MNGPVSAGGAVEGVILVDLRADSGTCREEHVSIGHIGRSEDSVDPHTWSTSAVQRKRSFLRQNQNRMCFPSASEEVIRSRRQDPDMDLARHAVI
jgi:hypothetical protein